MKRVDIIIVGKHRGLMSKTMALLKENVSELIPYIILLIIFVIMNFLQYNLFSLRWLSRKSDAVLALAFVAIGQTMVFLIGGMDWSIGGIICFINVYSSLYMKDSFIGILSVCVISLVIGFLGGMLNGFIIVKLHVQSFIATLTTWLIWSGLALHILPTDGGNPPAAFVNFMLARVGRVSFSCIILVCLIIIGLFLKTSRFGISMIAIGGNERGAYYGGVNVVRTKIIIFSLSGLLASMAGLFRTALVASGSPIAGNDYILQSCAAAVIGGVSMNGGKGSVIGAIAGAFSIKLLMEFLILAGVSTYWTAFFQGLLLIVAVGISSVNGLIQKKRRAEVAI
jgi:ribose transport system permease protein